MMTMRLTAIVAGLALASAANASTPAARVICLEMFGVNATAATAQARLAKITGTQHAQIIACIRRSEHGNIASALERTFEGNGSKNLAPFTTSKGETLSWSNTGPLMIISNNNLSGPDPNVDSKGRSGETYLPPGRYSLGIAAIGSWTIRIS